MGNDNLNPPYNDLMGDILKKHKQDGGMENLKGQGKPISKEYFSGDTFQHFQRLAKDAGYKPLWLSLQHEIRDEVIAIKNANTSDSITELELRVVEVNKKISKYNRSCPPPLQKGHISLQTIETAIERW